MSVCLVMMRKIAKFCGEEPSVCVVKYEQRYRIRGVKDAKNNYAGHDIKDKKDEGEEEVGIGEVRQMLVCVCSDTLWLPKF